MSIRGGMYRFMPRLTNHDYLQRHQFLKDLWNSDFQCLFGVLSSSRQWLIHRYYQPAKDLTTEELLAYRKTITTAEPTLPHRASRALHYMVRVYELAHAQYQVANRNPQVFRRALRPYLPSSRVGKRTYYITAIARPEPDYERMARARIALAEYFTMQEKEAA